MESNIKVSQVRIGEVTFISKNELEELLKLSEVVLEEDTVISGIVRILKYNNHYLFQEQTPKEEYIIRKFDDLKSAQNLVENRLQIYEKMWNGCGCRIDYNNN